MAPSKVSTVLKTYNLAAADVQKKFFLVDSEESAMAIAANNQGAVYVSLSDGSSVTDWTASKGVGNWTGEDENTPLVDKAKVYVAFSPVTMNYPKTTKFLKELSKEIAARGGGMQILTVPNGETVSSIAQKHLDLVAAMTPSDEELAAHAEDDMTDAEKLLQIAKADFNFHWSDEDGGFLTLKSGPKFAYVVSGGTPNLKNYLIAKFGDRYAAKVPSRTMVGDTMAMLEALCDMSDSRVRKLSIRASKSPTTGRVWIDLGRRDGLLVCINHMGWETSYEADPDVFFKRTDMVKELPIPMRVNEGDVKTCLNTTLRPHFNISDAEWPMVVAWMVTQVVPDYSAPVAMFLGESGSGKTTATSILSTVLENVTDNGALMPDGKDNLAVTISQEKISIWNNVSKISAATSDDICQYIDGASYRKRKLHSNNDVVSMTLEPSILLNGISFDEDLRPDLKTRSIVFNMKRMGTPTGSINDIVANMKKEHAAILGALYTLVSQVMRKMPETQLPDGGSRMAEYLKTIIIIDDLWDLGGMTLANYTKSSSEMSHESLESPIFKILHDQVVREENLVDGVYIRTFTNEELITLFNSFSLSTGNDSIILMDLALKTARKMTSYLNRNITDWKKFGIDFTDHGNTMVDGVRATRKTFVFDYSKSGGVWLHHNEIKAKQKF